MNLKVKFSEYNIESPFDYGRIYATEGGRLKIGADRDQTDLLLNLIDGIEPPYFVLYVLLVSRIGKELGRYQSPLFESKEELKMFLTEYKTFLETDGRHHVWIGTCDNSGLLVYDQHNVIFAYGPLDEYASYLEDNGFSEQSFSFPAPHIHNYHKENDEYEEKITNHFDWQIFPLADTDLYE